ncbi:MAG TPA: GntR family transcriptional regulator [Burkholderiales bacterium]
MIANITPPASLVTQTYEAILNAICEGTLAPGERITQEGIAERLNVSRQPVGQAFALLKTQGFVKEAGRRGLIVAHLEPVFFKAIYELRTALDPLAVRLAMDRITEAAIEEGRAIVAEGRRAVQSADLRSLIMADVRFHTYIYELSANPLIGEIMGLYWNHLRRAMGEVLRTRGEGDTVWREHEAIFEAMAAGQRERAAELARRHAESAVARVLPALEARIKAAE